MTAGSILVVDGRPESRASLVRVVKEAGYSALEAGTTAEALALLSSLHPQVVLLDIDQLDTNALDVARQVKLESTDVSMIILSSSGDRDLVVKARVIQADLDERGVERRVRPPTQGFGGGRGPDD